MDALKLISENTWEVVYQNETGLYTFRVMKHNNGYWVILEQNQSGVIKGLNLGTFKANDRIQLLYIVLTGTDINLSALDSQ
ncbi:MAG: hypothetical protein WCJ33_00295 [Pseudomonadota bacterium]